MESTDIMIFGLRDGRCVASAWEQSGSGAAAFNHETEFGWIRRGLEVKKLGRHDPVAKVLFDQMWNDANARRKAVRA